MKVVCPQKPDLFDFNKEETKTFRLSSSQVIQSLPIEKFAVQRGTTAKQRLDFSLKELKSQAQQVNLLSSELEKAILRLKAITDYVDLSNHYLSPHQSKRKRVSICEYSHTQIPTIKPKSNGHFVLVSRHLDIFKAEREARSVAQMLRRWSHKKRKIPRKEE
ncbi:MAG: hypothetical protein WA865_16010 [Spirulinaceae cyanobacterium]